MEKYNYLKEFIDIDAKNPIYDPLYADNWFYKISNINNLDNIEFITKIIFPNSLKEFWNEIGYGRLMRSFFQIKPLRSHTSPINYFLTPNMIAEIITDPEHAEGFILHLDHNEEMLENGFFPFFEECDSSYFLWMRPGEDKVYDGSARIIENNFEDFIYKLYHVHPQYYLFNEEELKAKLEEEKKQLEIEKQERGL